MPFVATPESIAKMRASQKARLADPAARAKLSAPRPSARVPKSDQTKERMRNSWTPERRAVHAERMRGNDRWKTRGRESNIERTTREWLEGYSVAWKQHENVCGFWVDFLVNDHIVIECDGEFWHSREGIPERDAMKDRTWRDAGYTVVRLSERAIKDGSAREQLENAL